MYFDDCNTIDELKAKRNDLLRQYHPDVAEGVNTAPDSDTYAEYTRICTEINLEYTHRSAEIALEQEAEENTDVTQMFLKAAVSKGVEALYKANPKAMKKLNDILSGNVADGIGQIIDLFKNKKR